MEMKYVNSEVLQSISLTELNASRVSTIVFYDGQCRVRLLPKLIAHEPIKELCVFNGSTSAVLSSSKNFQKWISRQRYSDSLYDVLGMKLYKVFLDELFMNLSLL